MNLIDSTIISSEVISYNYLLFTVETNHNGFLGDPGQFYEIQYTDDLSKLRIPISIYDQTDHKISFLIKIIGSKTQKLALLKPNDPLRLIGPLGKGFSSPLKKSNILLLTGGIGYAPLYYFSKSVSIEHSLFWIHGGKNREEVSIAIRDQKTDMIFTDDGSFGKLGFVTKELQPIIQQYKINLVYACGPEPMLISVQSICQAQKIKLYLSLEAYMACGIGACFGCAVKMKDHEHIYYGRVCTDGPVFASEKVILSDQGYNNI